MALTEKITMGTTNAVPTCALEKSGIKLLVTLWQLFSVYQLKLKLILMFPHGAVLNTINTRLDLNTITYIFEHGAKLVFADTQFLSVVEDAIAKLEGLRPTSKYLMNLQAFSNRKVRDI